MPIGFVHTWWYHLNSVGSKLYYHSNGFRGSIDSPLRSIQTRFCISCTTNLERSKQGFVLADLPFKTIWRINTVHSYFAIQNHNSEWFQMVHQLVWKKVPKVGELMARVCPTDILIFLWKSPLLTKRGLALTRMKFQAWKLYSGQGQTGHTGIWAMPGGLGPLGKKWAAGLDNKKLLKRNCHGKLLVGEGCPGWF